MAIWMHWRPPSRFSSWFNWHPVSQGRIFSIISSKRKLKLNNNNSKSRCHRIQQLLQFRVSKTTYPVRPSLINRDQLLVTLQQNLLRTNKSRLRRRAEMYTIYQNQHPFYHRRCLRRSIWRQIAPLITRQPNWHPEMYRAIIVVSLMLWRRPLFHLHCLAFR